MVEKSSSTGALIADKNSHHSTLLDAGQPRGTRPSLKASLPKDIRFVDTEGRQVLFDLNPAGTVGFWVNGRHKVSQVKSLHATGRCLHVDGKKLMTSACTTTVPPGQEELLWRVMELYGKRSPAPKVAQRLMVNIISARGLRDADWLPGHGSSDPYCICEIAGKTVAKIKTKHISNNLNPVWDYIGELEGFEPGDRLIFTVWDKDWFGKDDFLGRVEVKPGGELPSFSGEVSLQDAGKGIEAFLRLKILTGTKEERERQAAVEKMQALASIGAGERELEQAIAEARSLGVLETNEALRRCEGALAEVVAQRRKRELRVQLHAACDARSEEDLLRALDTVPVIGLGEEPVVVQAKRMVKAFADLRVACADALIDALEGSIKGAREAGLGDRELQTAATLLQALIRREDARRRLVETSNASIAAVASAKAALAAGKGGLEAVGQSVNSAKVALDAALLEAKAAGVGEMEPCVAVGHGAVAAARTLLGEVKFAEGQQKKARELLRKALASRARADLEEAVTAAQQAGLDEVEYQDARGLLAQEAETMKALMEALEDHSPVVAVIRSTLMAAQAATLERDRPEWARAAKLIETLVRKAGELIITACQSGDLERLKAAVVAGRAASLEDSAHKQDFEKASRLLHQEELKEEARRTARELLKEACTECTVEALQEAVTAAKDAKLDPREYSHAVDLLQGAEEARRREALRQKAFKELREAMASGTRKALTEAIRSAKAAGLPASEYNDHQKLLQEVIRRECKQALIDLQRRIEKGLQDGSIDETDLLTMMKLKEELSRKIQDAKLAGVDEADLEEIEVIRKRIHNRVEDLKGSIRVFCRVRPLSKKELDSGDCEITKQLDPMTIEVKEEVIVNVGRKVGEKKDEFHTFHYDSVFLRSSQETVFMDCRELVVSALDGYNVTIFAYGQTGAGKTFTMMGDPPPGPGEEDNRGIAPRTIDEIYKKMETRKTVSYAVSASVMELYCDDLVDSLTKTQKGASAPQRPLEIRHDKAGKLVIDGLTEEACESKEKLHRLVQKGQLERSIAKTKMNEYSSRSHLIIMIRISSTNSVTKEKLNSKIVLVDLAGSEQLKKSGSEGQQKGEAIEINKSLSALGDVIKALTEKRKHVPYRNHKLTHLLEDSLGGSAKALMFVNCSPANSNCDETLNSLRWAASAKKITNTYSANAATMMVPTVREELGRRNSVLKQSFSDEDLLDQGSQRRRRVNTHDDDCQSDGGDTRRRRTSRAWDPD